MVDFSMAGVADQLSLAAAPTFAIMALLTFVFGGPPDPICHAAHGASALSGMVSMYLLMSVFNSAPWLRLISRGYVNQAAAMAPPATLGYFQGEARPGA